MRKNGARSRYLIPVNIIRSLLAAFFRQFTVRSVQYFDYLSHCLRKSKKQEQKWERNPTSFPWSIQHSERKRGIQRRLTTINTKNSPSHNGSTLIARAILHPNKCLLARSVLFRKPFTIYLVWFLRFLSMSIAKGATCVITDKHQNCAGLRRIWT